MANTSLLQLTHLMVLSVQKASLFPQVYLKVQPLALYYFPFIEQISLTLFIIAQLSCMLMISNSIFPLRPMIIWPYSRKLTLIFLTSLPEPKIIVLFRTQTNARVFFLVPGTLAHCVNIPCSDTVRNLGVVLGSGLTFTNNISLLCQ